MAGCLSNKRSDDFQGKICANILVVADIVNALFAIIRPITGE
jgi:hypothetical protein